MARHARQNWNLPDKAQDWNQVAVAVLMDIRDELQTLVRLANCYRIPRALDAMIELGAEARRKKRAQVKKRKAART